MSETREARETREIVIRIVIEQAPVQRSALVAVQAVQATPGPTPSTAPPKQRVSQFVRRARSKLVQGSHAEAVYDAHNAQPTARTQELARLTGLKPQTVSSMLTRLIDRGFIAAPPWRRRTGLRPGR